MRETTSLIGEGFRVYVVALAGGLAFDSRVLFTKGPTPSLQVAAHAQVCVVLDGRMHLRRGERTFVLSAGHGIVEPIEGPWDERWEGDPFLALVVEWSAAVAPLPPTRTAFSCSRDEERLRGVARSILRDPKRAARDPALLSTSFGILDSLGILESAWPGEALGEDPRQPEADLLSHALSHLDHQPMWVDLAARRGVSERELRRRFAALPIWQEMTGLRAALVRARILATASLLSLPDLPVGVVARMSGYGSSRALGTALDQHGLPSATDLRRRARNP
ncbi:MAG: helix-turn-helix transcriptional regulator [Myxococcales bacterium]|nr:helix-turn-helix transcriptional regulator [Myxococcales bacterium]